MSDPVGSRVPGLVLPRSLRGEAPSHAPLLCSLWVAERPAPPRELLVPQAEVTARSLRLQWVPGSDGASPIRYFTVQVRELPGGEWHTYSSSISHEATACAVERYPEPGGPSPGNGRLLSSLLLAHAPSARDQASASWSPLGPPRVWPSTHALRRWFASPGPGDGRGTDDGDVSPEAWAPRLTP